MCDNQREGKASQQVLDCVARTPPKVTAKGELATKVSMIQAKITLGESQKISPSMILLNP